MKTAARRGIRGKRPRPEAWAADRRLHDRLCRPAVADRLADEREAPGDRRVRDVDSLPRVREELVPGDHAIGVLDEVGRTW